MITHELETDLEKLAIYEIITFSSFSFRGEEQLNYPPLTKPDQFPNPNRKTSSLIPGRPSSPTSTNPLQQFYLHIPRHKPHPKRRLFSRDPILSMKLGKKRRSVETWTKKRLDGGNSSLLEGVPADFFRRRSPGGLREWREAWEEVETRA